ncbi:hypothetical protein TNCV_4408201 [Trichonephila clavipes]|nr:hypothetical protein TNCV_4408201 [Trichonephila clavipes]
MEVSGHALSPLTSLGRQDRLGSDPGPRPRLLMSANPYDVQMETLEYIGLFQKCMDGPWDGEPLVDLRLTSLEQRELGGYKGNQKWSSGCGIKSRQGVLSPRRTAKTAAGQVCYLALSAQQHRHTTAPQLARVLAAMSVRRISRTDTAGSDVVQSGRPIFDDFFQHLWPYIGNNTANVVFQMVKRLWLIRIDQ